MNNPQWIERKPISDYPPKEYDLRLPCGETIRMYPMYGPLWHANICVGANTENASHESAERDIVQPLIDAMEKALADLRAHQSALDKIE